MQQPLSSQSLAEGKVFGFSIVWRHRKSISTPANHAIYDLILSSSLAGAFLLITALLPHMLVISLMAFTEVWVCIMVKSLGANL